MLVLDVCIHFVNSHCLIPSQLLANTTSGATSVIIVIRLQLQNSVPCVIPRVRVGGLGARGKIYSNYFMQFYLVVDSGGVCKFR